MKKKVIAIFAVITALVATAPVYAFEVPLYRFDGVKNDELYTLPGVATAESGVQIIMPDDTKETILPFGVSLLDTSHVNNAAATTSAFGRDGYPDVWGDSSLYVAGSVSSSSDASLSAMIQKDGSLGTLSIPALKLSANLYENDMSKGVGHIPGTALWNGNVCIMGHNRGVNEYFAELKKLSLGSKITLTTKHHSTMYN